MDPNSITFPVGSGWQMQIDVISKALALALRSPSELLLIWRGAEHRAAGRGHFLRPYFLAISHHTLSYRSSTSEGSHYSWYWIN